MDNNYHVYWRNREIGKLNLSQSDMGYVDGNWTSLNITESKLFEALVSTLKPVDVINNPVKGTRVILRSAHSGKELNALVLLLDNNRLFIKHIFHREAIAWLIENVY